MEHRRARRRARLGGIAGAAVLVLAGCGGGSEPKGESAARPSAPAQKTGAITGPHLKPAWLVEATSPNSNGQNFDRRAFGYLTSKLAVYSGADTLLAVDRKTGKTAWTADLDYRNQAACDLPSPAGDDPKIVVLVYGKTYCNTLAQVRLSDGEVLHTETLGGLGNDFSSCFQLEAEWYCLRMDGIYRVPAGGDSEQVASVAKLGGVDKGTYQDTIHSGSLSADGSTMLVEVVHQRVSQDPDSSLIAVRLSDFSALWEVSNGRKTGYDLLPGGRFLRSGNGSGTYELQGVADGKLLDAYSLDLGGDDEGGAFTELDPNLLRLVDDDFMYGAGRAVHRVRSATGEPVWSTDLSGMRLGGAAPEDFTVQTGPLSKDRTEVFATLQAERSGAMELVRLRLKDGKLTGRWAFPEEYAGSMNASPYLTQEAGGLLLVRNLSASDPYGLERRGVKGPIYDLGWFTFPTEEEQ